MHCFRTVILDININFMQVGLFGKKVGMTQIFDESGTALPVTIVNVGPCQVSQIKSKSTDGYTAIQVAYDEKKLDKLNKPESGHLKKSGDKGFRSLGEFRVTNVDDFKIGQIITTDSLAVGQKVRVTGTSIGKGFAGNQKRHNFSRGPMTHGSKNHRLPGSIGAGSTPGRVYPGKKMAGRLGGTQVTLKNTEVLCVDSQKNILVLKGSLPGKKNSILRIQPQT